MRKRGLFSSHRHKHTSQPSLFTRFLLYFTRSYLASGLASFLFVSALFGGYYIVTTSHQPSTFALISCVDLEHEKDSFITGAVVLQYDTNTTVYYSDVCSSDFTLLERSCSGFTFQEQTLSCEAGCFEGACIVPAVAPSFLASPATLASCTSYSLLSPFDALASSELAPDYSALHALDADLSTSWFGSPTTAFPKWVRFDVREMRCLSGVSVASFVHDEEEPLAISVSDDGLQWQVVLTNITSSPTPRYYSFADSYFARYVRVTIFNSSRSYGSLSEVQINMSPTQTLSYTFGASHA